MQRIESRINPSSEEFRKNRDAHLGAVKRLRAEIERIRAGGPEQARKRHVERGKLLARDRVRKLLDPQSPFLELSALAAYGMYDDEAPAAGIITGVGRVHGREARNCGQRRDGQGRHLLPDHGEEASARAGNRDGEPAPVRIPGRFGRRLPASAGGGVSRSRTLRAHLLQPGADVRDGSRAGRGRHGLVHGGRRIRARRCATRTSSSGSRARSFWPVRRWSAPRPARRSAPRSWAAATCIREFPGSAIIWPRTTATRSQSPARSSKTSAARPVADLAADRRTGGSPLRSRRALRHHPLRHAQAVRRARGDRANRGRQPDARVQGALRDHAW